ncbi:MAG: site-2 protease family protein [Isosphaeraceae bacterium]
MLASWKLGRVAGIDVFVHPTFLLVFLFTDVLRNGPLAVLLVLAVFGCVLLHEFGHALMARRFGIETEDITLYPIGGVARLRRLPRAPGAELLIALAGPAVNFAIVGALLLLGWMGLAEELAGTATGFFLDQMVVVNLFLGLFNLIPAFPLDGGRVLRALLSGWLGRVRATHVAATIGRTLAVLFGLSVLYTGYWIHVALAIFVYFAARAEELQVQHEERRRQYEGENQGVWVAPPGYRWVQRSDGVWQLAPNVVVQGGPFVGPSPWR